MNEAADQSKERTSGGVITAVAVLVFLYFFFPHVYLLPMVLIYGRNVSPPPAVEEVLSVAFAPIGYLAQRVPIYDRLIQAESELTGIR